jgi:hypothetical protein
MGFEVGFLSEKSILSLISFAGCGQQAGEFNITASSVSSPSTLFRYNQFLSWVISVGITSKKRSFAQWQVDGKKNKFYRQNLCYLAKICLDHQTP